MKIPDNILELINCSKCDNYLSRSPVYIQLDGTSLCNQCFAPEYTAIRNTLYESIANLLQFPCTNAHLGCEKTIPFAEQDEEIDHEKECTYRQYVCPLFGRTTCKWLGSSVDLLTHCSKEHNERILTNPVQQTHNITSASKETFLVKAFQELFILQIHISVTLGKINYKIQFLNQTDDISQYKFILLIKRQNEKIEKEIAAVNNKVSSLELNINTLIDMLGSWDKTMFTLTLHRVDSKPTEKCTKCDTEVTKLCYHSTEGWCCQDCISGKVSCKRKKCDYKDYPEKCKKHEKYFCTRNICCVFCHRFVSSGIITHCNILHDDITTYTGGVAFIPRRGWYGTWCLISFDIGTALCGYILDKTGFNLYLYLSVTTEELRKLECIVKVTNRRSGMTRTFMPDAEYDKIYDFEIDIKRNDFPRWNTDLDIVINVTEL